MGTTQVIVTDRAGKRLRRRTHSMSDTTRMLAIGFGCLVMGMALSYGGAKLGHPTAVWFWRDILGVLQ